MGDGVKNSTFSIPQAEKSQTKQDLEQLFEIVSRAKYMWESTFDAIGEPVMIINDTYEIERANLATAEIVKIDVRKLIGKKCYEIFAKRQTICPGCPLEKTLMFLTPHALNIEHFFGDKEFHVSSYPLQYKVTHKNSVVHHYRDVTEEKKLQRTIAQTEKMAALGMMAGGVAHEINNPLSGILAFSQLIQRDLDPKSSLCEDIKEIENAAHRCKGIVENLLNFSRQTKSTDRGPIDINETIESALPLFRMKLRTMNVEVATEYSKGLEHVFGNRSQIQQVILNLISNAADAMPEGGIIHLRTKKNVEGNFAKIEVQDTGIGIKGKNLNRIFDPYFTTKDLGNGTGLGLSISYNIIQEHQGKIEVQSEEGKGSIFTVLLPYCREKGKRTL
ncbi:MAG: hypothetical protein A3I75_05660 [Deltaproteobacteria bacterium RIFCSPLOWO2_02_FULL_50_16]|nr:MAG: hypothetical protein A2053_03180 [Deltaproteobacteria bacterium GWA2_50_8]OGQ29742.1 MAG: hypothetical protein A3B79_05110 [Deltaproteobacteria bacterium RIFCSPHIGHO2_02_FULL_50_15]OGQ56777.1 MAG: hypothetical protein A3I75_05660 [Deltaproteobacteria bacterium RIFCSPLOWO2_02_FULL_50_16]OGQ67302.1 MAG: hypothetical protein A3F89_04495 [Deltaproteobacteria bacterium RIFCSPLOWO2_12_FULL_50_11]